MANVLVNFENSADAVLAQMRRHNDGRVSATTLAAMTKKIRSIGE